MGQQVFSDEDILEAIAGTAGIKILIAKKLGCNRKTIDRRAAQSTAITEALTEETEVENDVAEGGLIKAVRAGQPWAIKFWLTTRAKHRGYSTSVQVTGSIETRSKVVIVRLPENGRETNAGNGNGNED